MDRVPVDFVLKPGDLLGGKYRVERVLGAGGMGVVVAARHTDLDKSFALKVLRPDAARDAESVERFVREARAAVRLRSEHCVHVVDVGRLDDGTPYMVMELLVGRDLAVVVHDDGPCTPKDATRYILQACEGIAEAHARGIVHRDIKLGNLVLTRRVDGRPLVKVLDFGLAKTISTSPELRALTQSTAVMGTPTYMSPEQMRASSDVDARTDVWSLGVCLYELLTAKPPFDGGTVPELCSQVLKEPPTPMPSTVPRALADATYRCLHKDKTARFADVAELAQAIEPFSGEKGAAARVRTVLEASHEDVESLRDEAPSRPDAEARGGTSFDTDLSMRARRTRLSVVAAVAFAGTVASSVIVALRPNGAPAPASDATPATADPALLHAEVRTEPPPPIITLEPAPKPPPTSSPEAVPAPAPAEPSVRPRRGRHSPAPAPPPPKAAPTTTPAASPVLQPKTTEF